ncbi:MAG: pseudouridine synthase, partial [Candidatus Falkowbacteria bacterium]|nr:pseudouridine synthase [Candidatus Falkowbacteria bacterium]
PITSKLFVVGRLDKDSRGLLLLTNDGDLTQKISHPKFEHKKVYEVRAENLKGMNTARVCETLLEGVDIGDDGLVRARSAKYLQNNQFIITLSEGKKRQIRRMMSGLDLQVIDLRRIKFNQPRN